MKIPFKDNSYIEFIKEDNDIKIILSAKSGNKNIINEAKITNQQFIEIYNEICKNTI